MSRIACAITMNSSLAPEYDSAAVMINLSIAVVETAIAGIKKLLFALYIALVAPSGLAKMAMQAPRQSKKL